MTAAQIEERRPEAEEIVAWRLEQLLAAGYEPSDAKKLARRFEIDLHQAVDLRRRGCPSMLAVSILR